MIENDIHAGTSLSLIIHLHAGGLEETSRVEQEERAYEIWSASRTARRRGL